MSTDPTTANTAPTEAPTETPAADAAPAADPGSPPGYTPNATPPRGLFHHEPINIMRPLHVLRDMKINGHKFKRGDMLAWQRYSIAVRRVQALVSAGFLSDKAPSVSPFARAGGPYEQGAGAVVEVPDDLPPPPPDLPPLEVTKPITPKPAPPPRRK